MSRCFRSKFNTGLRKNREQKSRHCTRARANFQFFLIVPKHNNHWRWLGGKTVRLSSWAVEIPKRDDANLPEPINSWWVYVMILSGLMLSCTGISALGRRLVWKKMQKNSFFWCAVDADKTPLVVEKTATDPPEPILFNSLVLTRNPG